MMFMPFVILAMAEGDDREFMEQLYRDYHRLMYDTAWKYSSDKYFVEDVVSDSCIALMKNIPKLRELAPKALIVYIITAVRNTALNGFKRHKVHTRVFSSIEDDLYFLHDDLSLERKVEIEDELQRVIAAIECLPENERQILKMKYLAHMEDEDIADSLGLAKDSIRMYVSRARKKIKKNLNEQ